MEGKLYNLTNPQKSIFLTEEYYRGTNINNISGVITINGFVDCDKLKQAIKQVVKQNDGCRIMISNENNDVKQYISGYKDFDIDIVNVSSDNEIKKIAKNVTLKPFDLYNSYLFKFVIFHKKNNSGGFIINMHHLIGDSWSLGIAINEIMEVYYKYLKNEEFVPKDADIYSYTNYIKSEQEYINSSKYEKDKAYWNEVFSDIPDNATIPSTDSNISLNSSMNALRKQFNISSDLLNNIKNYCTEKNVSLFNFLIAIFSIYISNASNVTNFCIGTPILNRSNFKEKNTIGMFINTLPIRINIDNNMSFADFLSNISANSMALLRHQKYSYQNILADLRNKQSNIQSLYNIMLSYQITKINEEQEVIPHNTTWTFNNITADDIDIHIFDLNDTNELTIAYDYQTAKYSDNDITNMHNRILNLISQVLNINDLKLSDIEIVTKEEKKKILEVFNESKVLHPQNVNVFDLIKNIGEKYPNQIAIKDENSSITYDELLKESEKIAKNLIKHNIKKSDCISILFSKKSIKLICSMLGVLRAGACFLAIYPNYPTDRIKYMLENSNSKLLITDSYNNNFNIPILNINDLENLNNACFPKANGDDNAYLIYTSGSTGNPKGTMQSHNNLVNFVYSFQHFFDNKISNNDLMLSVTNICFDVSIAEIFTPLIFGATLYLYKDLNTSRPDELASYIVKNNITFSYFPPSMLQSIYEELKKYKKISLNKMLVGVEPIKASTLISYLELNPDMKIINGYGPSETTICCTMYPFNKDLDPASITPIGRPIGNSKILILDSSKHITPIGSVGEIYVQGECVGNGYINNENETLERFDLKNRIYKTGDLAKWLPDGNILFIGRNDNQIKYRGYRIDLGEIEHAINNISSVENCAVLLDNKIKGNPILISFIVLKDNNFTEEAIRQNLTKILPHYMIPNQFVFLDSFPLTPNGKIDKKVLLSSLSEKTEKTYTPPTTELEKTLANLWEKVLNKNKIGIDDNFFEIGGDSLDAIKIVTLANQQGISLSAQDFYTYPTISLILKHCLEEEKNVTTSKNYVREIILNKKDILPFKGDILLIGSTGFLGAHLLNELIFKTDYTIYCLVRGKSYENSVSRLKERLNYYFKNNLDVYIGSRIIVVNGDFCKPNLGIEKKEYSLLLNKIKTVINSAAIVKHIGNYEYFHNINVLSVQNLIDFCKKCGTAHLVHISTLSVSGTYSNKENMKDFTEKDLYIDQNIEENIYIKTKFEAEQLLSKYILDGFNATIFRLGNITWRNLDGIFQINENENLFFTLLNFMIKLKKLPTAFGNLLFNVSPVDECADLIIKILQKANMYNVYHIYNFNTVTLKEIATMLNNLGFSIEFTDSKQSEDALEKQLINYPSIAEHFANIYKSSNIKVSSPITTKVVQNIPFSWTKIDTNYLKKKLGGLK